MAIITRAQWGARKPRSVTPCYWTPGGAAWVHYRGARVGSPIPSTPEGERAEMRNIQAYHQGQGWADIGYNFVVFPSGRAYEGRGARVVASHCPGHNTELGVCVIWDDGAKLPPAAALEAVLNLARRYDRRTLKGHRDGYSTSCPGGALYSWVQSHRVVGAAPAPVRVGAPWTFRAAGRGVFARGSLNHASVIQRITAVMHEAGHRAPWVATVDGLEIGRGRLWPGTPFKGKVSAALQAGSRVNLNGHNVHGGALWGPRRSLVSVAKED